MSAAFRPGPCNLTTWKRKRAQLVLPDINAMIETTRTVPAPNSVLPQDGALSSVNTNITSISLTRRTNKIFWPAKSPTWEASCYIKTSKEDKWYSASSANFGLTNLPQPSPNQIIGNWHQTLHTSPAFILYIPTYLLTKKHGQWLCR